MQHDTSVCCGVHATDATGSIGSGHMQHIATTVDDDPTAMAAASVPSRMSNKTKQIGGNRRKLTIMMKNRE